MVSDIPVRGPSGGGAQAEYCGPTGREKHCLVRALTGQNGQQQKQKRLTRVVSKSLGSRPAHLPYLPRLTSQSPFLGTNYMENRVGFTFL